MLIIVLALTTSWATAKPIKAGEMYARATEIPSVLYWEAREASGDSLCSKPAHSRRIRALRNDRFDRIYGRRFNRLVQIIAVRDGTGWPDDFILVGGCIRATGPATEREERVFRAFGGRLEELETKYGISEAVR